MAGSGGLLGWGGRPALDLMPTTCDLQQGKVKVRDCQKLAEDLQRTATPAPVLGTTHRVQPGHHAQSGSPVMKYGRSESKSSSSLITLSMNHTVSSSPYKSHL